MHEKNHGRKVYKNVCRHGFVWFSRILRLSFPHKPYCWNHFRKKLLARATQYFIYPDVDVLIPSVYDMETHGLISFNFDLYVDGTDDMCIS